MHKHTLINKHPGMKSVRSHASFTCRPSSKEGLCERDCRPITLTDGLKSFTVKFPELQTNQRHIASIMQFVSHQFYKRTSPISQRSQTRLTDVYSKAISAITNMYQWLKNMSISQLVD